jgi:general stress protein 26
MKQLSDSIIEFFRSQGYVVVNSIDPKGSIHSACKGIVDIERSGKVYLFDLFLSGTYGNLQKNPRVGVVAVDEHKFSGYCLKGVAQIVAKDKVPTKIFKLWEDMVTQRLTRRIIRNLKTDKAHPSHPEASLPDPQYLIVVDVEEIVDLKPPHGRGSQEERHG